MLVLTIHNDEDLAIGLFPQGEHFTQAAREYPLRFGDGFEPVPLVASQLGVFLGDVGPPFIRKADGDGVFWR